MGSNPTPSARRCAEFAIKDVRGVTTQGDVGSDLDRGPELFGTIDTREKFLGQRLTLARHE